MKRQLAVFVLLSLALTLAAGLGTPGVPVTASFAATAPPSVQDQLNPGGFQLVTKPPVETLKPEFTFPDKLITLPPIVTRTPQTEAPGPSPTPRGDTDGGGRWMTSEGPLFLSFKRSLTDEKFMFTPMDLGVDGEFTFPLVSSAEQVVGEVNVLVSSGLAVVTYTLRSGVSVDRKDEFFTFFPDMAQVNEVRPAKLKDERLEFGIPYSVASLLGSDNRVLLYVNCPVSYKKSSADVGPFSYTEPAYLARVMELVKLMD